MMRKTLLCTALSAFAVLAACTMRPGPVIVTEDGFAAGCRAGYLHADRRLTAPADTEERRLFAQDGNYRRNWSAGFDRCFSAMNWPGSA